jgi:hypothetical protein
LIRKQIRDGWVISDRERGTPSHKIEDWIKVSRRLLALMEDRVPALREFGDLNFYRRMPEHDVESEVVEEGDRFQVLQTVDEDRWSQSWFRDEGDHPFDFNFNVLQRAVELLELADEKLQLDCASETAQDVSSTALPLSAIEGAGGSDGSGCKAGPNPLNRNDRVDRFLRQCTEEARVKVLRKHIWMAAKHQTPRQFQYWQKSDQKATAPDNQTFDRILTRSPADFVAELKRRGLI